MIARVTWVRVAMTALAVAAAASCKGPTEPAGPATPGPGSPAEAFRAAPPAPGPSPELVAPVPERQVLESGLTVLSASKHELPLVHLSIVVRSGSAADPREQPGVAGFLADVLKAGTTTRTADAIAQEIETLGATLHVEADEDALILEVTALTPNFPAVFDVVSDVLLNPAFAPEEVERVRRQRLADLAEQLDDPSQIAGRVFRKTLFGEHPYGHDVLGTEASLEAIDRAALRSFYESHFHPANAAVILVGDVTGERAVELVSARLGGWRRQGTITPPPAPPADPSPAVVLVDRKNAPQSQLRIGHLGIERSNPDYYPLVMLNAILGGQFNSRINMNLREDKGFTYGARSVFDAKRGRGSFMVYTSVRTDSTGQAIREVLGEIRKMRSDAVTEEELTGAKARYSLSLPGYFQSVDGVGAMVSNIYVHDLPLDYYQQLPDAISAVSVGDVRRVAEKYLHPTALSIVVVGDKAAVESGLQALERGAVRQLDPSGRPI